MMKSFFLAALLLGAFNGVALAAPAGPPGQVYDTAPFNQNPQHFTATTCVAQKFDCDNPPTDKELIAIANTCAAQTGFPSNLLGIFAHKAPYENCALPTSYVSASANSSGKAQWPICCIVPKGDKCTFQCHTYFAN